MPRKAKKKQYFTQETEDAIIRYNEQMLILGIESTMNI